MKINRQRGCKTEYKEMEKKLGNPIKFRELK